MTWTWTIKEFTALTLDDLYSLLRLRVDVFVVEQACPYHELDGKDHAALHIWTCGPDRRVAACARILPPGLSYPGVSLGRVVVDPAYRSCGMGHCLVNAALDAAKETWPGVPVHIGAQAHLEGFYTSHGFVTVSDTYLEDDIPHIDMVLNRT